MSAFDIIKQFNAKKSFRIASVMGKFDLQSEKVLEHFVGDIDLSDDWNVALIYGASGTGKTTIAKELFKDDYVQEFNWSSRSVIDDMPIEKSVDDITKMFNSVGFATVWSWLKPYSVLSTGEKMRVNLARALLSQQHRIVFDEYSSVVNRDVAKIASYAASKVIRKMNKKFIAISCHDDILEWLEPDWTFCTDTMTFSRRSLQRPKIKIEIIKCNQDAWPIFRKYHYLNTNLNKSAQCYVGIYESRPIVFFAVMHFPHPRETKFKRGHRLVVLPDFQGVGIGHRFSSAIAKIYKNAGFRFIITSATQSLYKQRSNDKNWLIKRISRTSSMRASSTQQSLSNSLSNSKYTFGYEYIG